MLTKHSAAAGLILLSSLLSLQVAAVAYTDAEPFPTFVSGGIDLRSGKFGLRLVDLEGNVLGPKIGGYVPLNSFKYLEGDTDIPEAKLLNAKIGSLSILTNGQMHRNNIRDILEFFQETSQNQYDISYGFRHSFPLSRTDALKNYLQYGIEASYVHTETDHETNARVAAEFRLSCALKTTNRNRVLGMTPLISPSTMPMPANPDRALGYLLSSPAARRIPAVAARLRGRQTPPARVPDNPQIARYNRLFVAVDNDTQEEAVRRLAHLDRTLDAVRATSADATVSLAAVRSGVANTAQPDPRLTADLQMYGNYRLSSSRDNPLAKDRLGYLNARLVYHFGSGDPTATQERGSIALTYTEGDLPSNVTYGKRFSLDFLFPIRLN